MDVIGSELELDKISRVLTVQKSGIRGRSRSRSVLATLYGWPGPWRSMLQGQTGAAVASSFSVLPSLWQDPGRICCWAPVIRAGCNGSLQSAGATGWDWI